MAPDAAGGPTPGFYIAHHPWLRAVSEGGTATGGDDGTANGSGGARLFKVGHTGDLRARLNDGAYVTCYPPGWTYVATFETADKDAAWLLESAVLDCVGAHRLGSRELVALPAARLQHIAENAARALGIVGALRAAPVYDSVSRATGGGSSSGGGSGTGGGDLADPRAPLYSKAAQSAVAHLRMSVDDDGGVSADIAGTAAAAGAAGGGVDSAPFQPAESDVEIPAGAKEEDDVFDDDTIDAPPPELEHLQLESRAYQADAVADCELELDSAGRAILQMACRSGKTYVAYRILAKYLARGEDVLFLVPSLSLLAQTAQKLVAYMRADGVAAEGGAAASDDTTASDDSAALLDRILLVGSASRPVPMPGGACMLMTTDQDEIDGFLAAPPVSDLAAPPTSDTSGAARRGRLVVSTYQSSPRLPEVFRLAIFDEAHRTAGPCGGRTPRPATHVLLNSAHQPNLRCLFMSATPAFDVRVSAKTLSMRDASRYGVVAYHYHLRQGIAAGFITNFSVEFVGGHAPPAAAALLDDSAAGAKKKDSTASKKKAAATTSLDPVSLDMLARQVIAAMGTVDRLLVFCRTVADADALSRRARELQREYAAAAPNTSGGASANCSDDSGDCGERSNHSNRGGFTCVSAHSYRPAAENAEALRLLRTADASRRVALFNCRMFQEGTEVPPLEGVFFAAPRSSVRDIMQIVCRALNLWPGKERARVFLPVTVVAGEDLNSAAALDRFARVTPVVDALIQEDPQLFDHLLDPENAPYPLGWVSDGGPAAAGLSAARRAALLANVRRVLRQSVSDIVKGREDAAQRLLTPKTIPWDAAFAYLRDRVVGQWRRYPKASKDVMPYGNVAYDFSKWMKLTRKRWAASTPSAPEGAASAPSAPNAAASASSAPTARASSGGVTPLSAAQRRDLASLPGWDPYGIQGPYPVEQCLDFLDEWLATHDGVPPMVETNKGGFVGIDATMVERLSGLLMQANQLDKIAPLDKPLRECFSAERAVIYDRLAAAAAKHNLVWPKPRRPDGRTYARPDRTTPREHMSFIQESFERFKAEHARGKKSGTPSAYIEQWFPGYPTKHFRQETLETIRNDEALRSARGRRLPASSAARSTAAATSPDSSPVAAARARGRARREAAKAAKAAKAASAS